MEIFVYVLLATTDYYLVNYPVYLPKKFDIGLIAIIIAILIIVTIVLFMSMEKLLFKRNFIKYLKTEKSEFVNSMNFIILVTVNFLKLTFIYVFLKHTVLPFFFPLTL